jgi:hypothetical protein
VKKISESKMHGETVAGGGTKKDVYQDLPFLKNTKSTSDFRLALEFWMLLLAMCM